MAYDPQQLQQQRPEQQTANNNRQGLNIQQPGELSDFDRQFFSPENWNKKPVEASVTAGDILKAATAAPLDMVAAGGELFRAGNQILDNKHTEQIAENPNPIGLDDQTMEVMRQNAGNPVSRAGNVIIQGVGNLAGAASQKIKDSYSDGAKKAASLDFVSTTRDKDGNITGLQAGEGLFDKDAWLINAVPSISQIIASGAMSKLGATAAREMAERAAFNRLSKSMPEEAARQLAKETADRAAAVAGKSTFVGTMTGASQGQGGIDMRNEINALSFDELTQSKTFQQAFSDIDSDPQYAKLDDTQKLTLARNITADRAATAVTADPRLLAVNIAASTLGDHTLLSLLTKKGAASGVASGVAVGALSEGATEFVQGAGQRYVQNQQLIDTAGQKIDPMKDVLEVGANNAVVGAGMGGAIGVVGGMRGHRSNQSPDSTDQPVSQVDTPEWKASHQEGNQDNGSSIPVVKMGDDAPPPGYTGEWRDGGPVISVTEGAAQPALSPYEEARQRYATQDRAAVLREYASADLTNNSELKRAASERLDELDQHDKIAQKVEAFKQQSDDELLTTYRKLNENPKRSDEEQLQHEAVRTVLSERLGIDAKEKQQPAPQKTHQQAVPEVASSQLATPDNQSPNGIPSGHVDTFRDTPAYLRQDPRIQGFAEDSDVQRALAEQQYAPTAEELISQQMEQGDQGYTPEEQAILEQAEKIRAARTPRLPAPGKTSVIAMPGDLHPIMSDEGPAGSGPQFDAGRQVRGQSFIPAERPQAGNEVGRASQTYDSETVPTHAIEDKGIIFSGSPTIDEGQTAQPPEFTAGETRTQRKTREFTEAMGGNNQAALPDQRHRVAGVPVDATTEAYARGESVGELKFYTKDRPFTSEHLARHSKWGKTPGATVEEVDGGYAVRLPPDRTKDTITLPSGEVLTVMMDHDVPGSAILTTEGGERIGLSATQVDGIKSELAGDRPVSGGIGDLARLNAALEHIRTHSEHRGYPLFPVDATRRDTGEKVKAWAVQAKPDSPIKMKPIVFETREEALSYANQLADRDESNASSRSKRETDRKDAEATKARKRAPIDEFLDAQSFTPMRRGKVDKALQEIVHYSEFDRPVTRAEAVQELVSRGWHPETAQRKSGDGKVKTLYRIVSNDGDLYNVTKAEHDFASHLIRTIKTRETGKGTDFYARDNASKNGGVAVSGADIGGGNIIHDGSFSKDGHKPETGMLRDRVQLASDLFVSHLNGAAKIKVKAVQTQAEAAAMMPNGIPAEFGTVHAIYQPELSRVIVIADNIAGPRELRAKLRHEIIAHHGLASVIGDVEYDRIMRVLHQTRDSQNKTIQEVWRQVERSYGNESLEDQANEFLAHMAERTDLTGLGGVWDRFVTLLTTALRKVGMIGQADITPAEIRNILRTITGRFKKTAMYASEKPGTREFEDTFSRTDALYSKAEDTDPLRPLPEEAEQYRTELDNAMRSRRSGDMSIKIGRTPPVLRALGAPNLDMYINRDTVRKATNGVKHDVPISVIEQLPELMHDPLAVYRSATQDNAVVALLEAQDANGNPVVSAVHMSAALKRIEVNRIASVYGTVGGMAKVNGMKEAGLTLYQRKKENPDNPHSQGLQLPKEERSYQGSDSTSRRYSQGLQLSKEGDPAESDKNILSSDDIRKNKALYSRTGTPAMDAETSRKMGFNVEKGWFDKSRDFWQMATDKDKTALKQWWRETFRKLNTRTFDGLAPLKYAEDATGNFDASVSGYTAARMAAGAGAVSGVVWEHGLVRYNKKDGITERIAGTGKADSLMGIFDALGNQRENFLKWIAGHRSERLMAEGRENNFTADEIAYMKTLNRGNETLFADQKRKYDAFIKSILDLQQDMGLIDPESRATWEDAWYLPYFREAENGETHGPWTTRGVANQSSTVRKLKGSELTIKDPIENLFNYVAKSVDASMKNEAMRRSVVNLADTGVVEVIGSPNKMDYGRIGKDVVKVYVDGQEQLVQVNDPDLYRAFTMIDMERSNSVFMKAARQAKRVLTIGTTAMPDFIIRNFMRDSLHSWAINKDGFRAGVSSWQGLRKALATDDTLIDMMAAGATFGGGYLNVYDPAGSAANIRKVLRRKGYSDSQMREFESTLVRSSKDVLDKLETAWEKYRHISEGSENANRVATYDAALKSGKSRAQAAFEARDLMDFSMMGSSKLIIGLTDVVPFLNARLQGMSKLGRAIKEDPREVLKRGGYIAGVSLALLALNWDDKRYEELPDWDKDAYWHFWAGDQHIRFPKPFEIGLMFGTMPERFVRMLGGEDSPGKFGKVIARNFMETMAFNPIPQVVKPIAEAYVNYDFFRGGPIENMADSNLVAEARYNDQTSLLMREIGAATGLSPKMLDHVVQGYTGTLGVYVLGATNILARQFSDAGETPALRLDELPVIKSFLRGSAPAKSTQFADDFYRMMSQANQINRTINAYREQGRKDDASALKEENAELLSKRKMLTNTQHAIRKLNDRIEMVRIDRTLSADEKRERIDRMMAQRNTLYQQAVERVNPYFDR
ncbi:hypothetical protein Dpoa2040_003635 [Dickeya sp. CFBP 2040]|uniref:LPD38 domain-containing protein n=1 Tax=Dickeya sp. CFBP 2040 TaxID=2718531 RepID=UPI0014455766|nr:LPD38 domain-containing protein [Dickeya sp. CFBP 2040]NKI76292.1 hypothetical protein [Dickeya sp. CFBP 2040]